MADEESERFEDIAELLYPDLVRRLTLVLHDHPSAEDVAQSALLRGYEVWSPGTIKDARAWIFTIGIRLALNERRRTCSRRTTQQRHDRAPARDRDLQAVDARNGAGVRHPAHVVQDAGACGVCVRTATAWIVAISRMRRFTSIMPPEAGGGLHGAEDPARQLRAVGAARWPRRSFGSAWRAP